MPVIKSIRKKGQFGERFFKVYFERIVPESEVKRFLSVEKIQFVRILSTKSAFGFKMVVLGVKY